MTVQRVGERAVLLEDWRIPQSAAGVVAVLPAPDPRLLAPRLPGGRQARDVRG